MGFKSVDERLLRDWHASFCCGKMPWRERTCGHAGVQESSQLPAHAHDEFVVRVEEPLADFLLGWVQLVCEGMGARSGTNGCRLLYTNCSGLRIILVPGRGLVSAQRVGSNVC